MSNNGPYIDIDDQEYRPGPIAPVCADCGLPAWLCECAWLEAMHREPRGEADAIIGWWPTAIFAVAALAIAIVAVRVL